MGRVPAGEGQGAAGRGFQAQSQNALLKVKNPFRTGFSVPWARFVELLKAKRDQGLLSSLKKRMG
jgi:hypothetical protein